MKFKTKEELMKNDGIFRTYYGGINDAFKSFAEPIDFFRKYQGRPLKLWRETNILQKEENCHSLVEVEEKFCIGSSCINFDSWLFDYCFKHVMVL